MSGGDRMGEVWQALEGLRDSDVVASSREDARRFARRHVQRRAWQRGALAGAACFVLAAVLLWTQLPPDAIRTGVGEMRVVQLEDGTSVTLNTGSVLRVRLTHELRAVELVEGQAYFAVMHDASRPFRVTTPNGSVDAIGTEFDVRVESAKTTVTLVEGKVAVRSAVAAAPVLLSAGEQVVLAPQAAVLEKHAAPTGSVTAWRRATIDLSDTRLGEAVAEMNRYSQVKLQLADPQLAELRVSGVFRTGDVRSFTRALESYWNLRVRKAPNGVLVLER